MSYKAVLFDLDGTLTKKDTYIPFLGLCIKEFKILVTFDAKPTS